jgi:glutamine synthetase
MGIDCIQGDHEDAPGQLELNWTYDDVERTSDRLTTYRQICAQVAREFNVIACFMTKPFMRVSANGCHHNFSLWKGGKDAVLKLGGDGKTAMPDVFKYVGGGDNKFDPEGDDQRMPGKIGVWAAGGIIKHLPALTAMTSWPARVTIIGIAAPFCSTKPATLICVERCGAVRPTSSSIATGGTSSALWALPAGRLAESGRVSSVISAANLG